MFLHSQYVSMAAYPALFPVREFWRKNQDQFEFAPFGQPRRCIEKNTIAADVACFSFQFNIAGTFYTDGYARGDSLP